MKRTQKALSLVFVLLVLTLDVGYSREAKKQFYFVGGGGEPLGETTIFDGGLKMISSFVAKSDWETTISFNGNHKRTEEIINTKLSKAKNIGPFVESNYNKLVDEMIQKIESGEIQPGDQVMLTIDTHGAQNRGTEITHNISLSGATATDLVTLAGASSVKLDGLEKLIQVAGNKGVKLAIMDMSCFSGNLLNLKSDKVCLISSTGTDQFGYAGTANLLFFNLPLTFSSKFYDSMKKGKNLEDIFLNSRAYTLGGVSSPDFPMISTPEGREINDLLYKLISPYLKYNDDDFKRFSSRYSSNDNATFKDQVCQYEQNHEQLKKFLKMYEDVNTIGEQTYKNEFSQLISALEDYRSFQLKYEKAMRGKFDLEEEVKEMLMKKYPDQQKRILKDYSPLALMQVDFEQQQKIIQNFYDHEEDKNAKKIWIEMIDNVKVQKTIAEDIKFSLSDSAKNKIKLQEEAYANTGATKGLANRVATEAKKVYQTLYKQMKKTTSNPCRDFVL